MRASAWHPDWLVPDWPAPAHVRAVFTTRAGGVSLPPFDSLNLGRPSGDDVRAVDTNRARLAAAIGLVPTYLSQVHGVQVAALPGDAAGARGAPVEADACTTRERQVVCAVRVADCLPVLLTDFDGRAVAAAHAGWRGLVNGVLEATWQGFAAQAGALPAGSPLASRTLAWLGPCIGPQAFEVGPEVRAAFLERDAQADACFKPHVPGKWLADLPALARMRLRALGVHHIHGNDGGAPWCTVANPSRFFSHRRDSVALGGSGRMAACIWLDRG